MDLLLAVGMGLLCVAGLVQVFTMAMKWMWGKQPLRGCTVMVPVGGEEDMELRLKRIRSALLWGDDLGDTQMLVVYSGQDEAGRYLCRKYCDGTGANLVDISDLPELVRRELHWG